MKQSIHELLPEMAWQAGVLYELGRIVKLLESIEAGLFIKDDIDWESADMTDYVSM